MRVHARMIHFNFCFPDAQTIPGSSSFFHSDIFLYILCQAKYYHSPQQNHSKVSLIVIMERQTADDIITAQIWLSTWSSKLVVPHGNSKVDVSCAAYQRGQIRQQPLVDNLPKVLPNRCLYGFDPNLFNGRKCASDIENIIKSSCDGCTLHRFKWCKTKGNRLVFSLRCACYRTQKKSTKASNFDDNKFSKIGVKPEEVVQSNSKTYRSYNRMSSNKLSKPSKGQKRKRCCDSRDSLTVYSDRKDKNQIIKRKTLGNLSLSRSTSCKMCVHFSCFLIQACGTLVMNLSLSIRFIVG